MLFELKHARVGGVPSPVELSGGVRVGTGGTLSLSPSLSMFLSSSPSRTATLLECCLPLSPLHCAPAPAPGPHPASLCQQRHGTQHRSQEMRVPGPLSAGDMEINRCQEAGPLLGCCFWRARGPVRGKKLSAGTSPWRWMGQTTWLPSLSHRARYVAQPGVPTGPSVTLGMSASLA